jgi:apolipoprotein D and lipocalin family protein
MGISSSIISDSTVVDFQPQLYAGKWYELARYERFPWEKGCLYATADYTWNSTTNIMKIVITCYTNQGNFQVEGEARTTGISGKLIVFFKNVTAPYWIHWTDYKNYSIVGAPSGRYLWILGRKKQTSNKDKDSLSSAVQKFGYTPGRLVWNYFPVKHSIDQLTKNNSNFASVVETLPGVQIVLNSLKYGQKVEWERHKYGQSVRVVSGKATVRISGQSIIVNENEIINIPAGVLHLIENNNKKTVLKFYSVYGDKVH